MNHGIKTNTTCIFFSLTTPLNPPLLLRAAQCDASHVLLRHDFVSSKALPLFFGFFLPKLCFIQLPFYFLMFS